MKKFFTTKIFSQKTITPEELGKSVETLNTDFETLSKEVQELEKQTKIEEQVSEELEKQLNEEITKNDAIDKDIEDLQRQEKFLNEEIETQEKEIQSLNESQRNLEIILEKMVKEREQHKEEYERELKELDQIYEQYLRQLEVKRQSYHSLKQIMSESYHSNTEDDKELVLLKKRYTELEADIESVENQIKDIKENKNKKPEISAEILEWYSDPIQVITKISEINVENNRLKTFIDNEFIGRKTLFENQMQIQSNKENNELIPISETIQKNSDIGSDSSNGPIVTTNMNIFELRDSGVNISSITSTGSAFPSSFGLFGTQSPDFNPFFGTQESDKTDESNVEQSDGFNPFGNQSTTSSVNNTNCNPFGNKSPSIESDSGFGFKSLFDKSSEVSSSTNSTREENSFNFFK